MSKVPSDEEQERQTKRDRLDAQWKQQHRRRASATCAHAAKARDERRADQQEARHEQAVSRHQLTRLLSL